MTGMLTHGHGQEAYGHFSLSLWPPTDPNFTVASLALCLQNMEREDKHEYGDLVHDGLNTSSHLLNCVASRKALDIHLLQKEESNPYTK